MKVYLRICQSLQTSPQLYQPVFCPFSCAAIHHFSIKSIIFSIKSIISSMKSILFSGSHKQPLSNIPGNHVAVEYCVWGSTHVKVDSICGPKTTSQKTFGKQRNVGNGSFWGVTGVLVIAVRDHDNLFTPAICQEYPRRSSCGGGWLCTDGRLLGGQRDRRRPGGRLKRLAVELHRCERARRR